MVTHGLGGPSWSTQVTQRVPASGEGGAVAAGHPMSVEAGMAMLAAGGNAVDAAVAAALVAGVVEPQETTLAGCGFLLVQRPGDEPVSVDFGPRAPAAARPDMFRVDRERVEDRGLGVSAVIGDENIVGAKATGVPGTIRGLLAAHSRFGVLDRSAVMAPAIEAAGDGFDAYPSFVLGLVGYRDQLLQDPASSEVFLPGGHVPMTPHMGSTTFGPPATRIVNERLARTLARVSDLGPDSLATGEVAADLVATIQENGGILSAADLAQPRVAVGEPLLLDYRGHVVATTAAPSGGLTELQMLAAWLQLHPESVPADDLARITDLARLGFHAFADRYHWLGDPDVVPVPVAGLLSAEYAGTIADLVRQGAPRPQPPRAGFPWDVFAGWASHDPWPDDPSAVTAPRWRPDGGTEPASGTTHVSVIDGSGMAVSITHTAANLFGAHLMCPRTGLMLDSSMGWFNAHSGAANSISGGGRPLANMGPLLIARDGVPVIALGAPGGRRIVSALVQVVVNLIDRGMSVAEALSEPRVDASGGRLLVAERLRHLVDGLPSDLDAVLVPESGEFLSYEFARPVLVAREGSTLQASVHPSSPGGAAAW